MSTPAIAPEHNDLSFSRPFSQILKEEIANGNASSDTVRTYRQQFKLFVSWCDRRCLEITQLTEDHIKEYRGSLVDRGLKVATIGLKLLNRALAFARSACGSTSSKTLSILN